MSPCVDRAQPWVGADHGSRLDDIVLIIIADIFSFMCIYMYLRNVTEQEPNEW